MTFRFAKTSQPRTKWVAHFELSDPRYTHRYETQRPALAELWGLLDPPYRVTKVTKRRVPFTGVLRGA